MGTNYYLHEDICEHCGRSRDKLHIGKSSGGWCFLLHVDLIEELNCLDDWKALFDRASTTISDEYGDHISTSDMLAIITERSRSTPFDDNDWLGYASEAEFHRSNYSERGPNNLLRSRIDGTHCTGHGDGTWDHITGDFS